MRVISYWSGPLPKVAQLHFASFLDRTSEAQYELFIENADLDDPESQAMVATLAESGRITIHGTPWEDLELEHVAPSVTVQDLRSRGGHVNIVGPVFRRLAARACVALNVNRISGLRGSFSKIGGWDFATDSRLFSWTRWHTYRADIFRVLAPQLYPGEDVLWVDLDTVFIRDFDQWPLDQSFVYRWDTQPHGNNAVIFFAAKSAVDRHVVQHTAVDLRTFRPWHLFSDERCEELGFKVLDPEAFDPAWDPTSSMAGSPQRFTLADEESVAIVEEIESRCVIAHWHNQWRTEPDGGSPWSLLMSTMTSQDRAVRGS